MLQAGNIRDIRESTLKSKAIHRSIAILATMLLVTLVGCQSIAPPKTSAPRLNVLLITADDLNYDSLGCYGCSISQITPNIDRLADEGMRFTNAHVNIAVCQPCRQSIMTGRYPHRNGAQGFEPIDMDVPTLQEQLHNAGYLNGILGKEKHMQPVSKYMWDYVKGEKELASGAGIGRSPELYEQYTAEFLKLSKEQNKPFFLMANSHDPHRPFADSESEKRSWGHDLPKFTRRITDDEVPIPDFLPDLPNVRKEVAQYYTSVYRCDQTVGAILQALKDSGLADSTIVMFLSDNGMATPFAKANCYLNSTKTPWIISWPGKIKPGAVDSEHFISGIDFMPTILEMAGIEAIKGMDGTSFLPLLHGKKQQGREYVYTEFHKTYAPRPFPMRCVQDEQFGYIFNFWAGKTKPMRMDSTSGLTFNAMEEAAESNQDIAARVELFNHRVPEEFYDFKNDPGGMHNLIDDPKYQKEIDTLREKLEEHLRESEDWALDAFLNRDDPAVMDAFMEEERKRAIVSRNRRKRNAELNQ